jgi:hypothetical protein
MNDLFGIKPLTSSFEKITDKSLKAVEKFLEVVGKVPQI